MQVYLILIFPYAMYIFFCHADSSFAKTFNLTLEVFSCPYFRVVSYVFIPIVIYVNFND